MEKDTRHHLIAKSKGGTYNKNNIIMLPRNIHDSVHLLFSNDLPLEIIRWITDRYRRVFDPQAYHNLNKAIGELEWKIEVYNPNCYNPDILKKYLWKCL